MIFHCPVQISYVYLNEIKVVVVVVDVQYSMDCAMICDVDCACTSRHMDRNKDECAFKYGFLLQNNYYLGCFVAIATAYARS